MASRSKWEAMTSAVGDVMLRMKGKPLNAEEASNQAKFGKASTAPIGSGTAEKAKKNIEGYYSRQKKAIEEQTK